MDESFVTEEEAVFIVQQPVMMAPLDLMRALCKGLTDMTLGPVGFDVQITMTLHVPGDHAEVVEEAALRNGVRLLRV